MNSPPVSVGSLRGTLTRIRSIAMTAVTLELDTASARAPLRGQIARLERELAQTLATTYPAGRAPGRRSHHDGPRLLGLRELELTRDALVEQVSDVRRRGRAPARRAGGRARQARRHARQPARAPGERVTALELGLPGCTVYAVRQSLLTQVVAGQGLLRLSVTQAKRKKRNRRPEVDRPTGPAARAQADGRRAPGAPRRARGARSRWSSCACSSGSSASSSA